MHKKPRCFLALRLANPPACRAGSTCFVFRVCYIEYAPLTNIHCQTHGGGFVLLWDGAAAVCVWREGGEQGFPVPLASPLGGKLAPDGA